MYRIFIITKYDNNVITIFDNDKYIIIHFHFNIVVMMLLLLYCFLNCILIIKIDNSFTIFFYGGFLLIFIIIIFMN